MAAHSDLRNIDPLSERQCDVLRLIADGRTNPEIASALGITVDGVKWHVREILSKLGVDSRESAAEWWRHERRPLRHAGRIARRAGAAAAALLGARTAIAAAAVAVVSVASVVTLVMVQRGNAPDRPPAVSVPATGEATPSLAAATATSTAAIPQSSNGPFRLPALANVIAMTYVFPLPDPQPPGPFSTDDPAQRAVIERVLGWLGSAQYVGPDAMRFPLRRTNVALHLDDGTTLNMSPAFTCTLVDNGSTCTGIAEEISFSDSNNPGSVLLLRSSVLADWLPATARDEFAAGAAAYCQTRNLTLALDSRPPSAPGTGRVKLALEITNESATACALYGYPYLELDDEGGQRLDFAISSEGGFAASSELPRPVVLGPGDKAYVVIERYRCDTGTEEVARTLHLQTTSSLGGALTLALQDYPRFNYCNDNPQNPIIVSRIAGSLADATRH